ncbi:MAG: hypothetical protein ACRERE_25175 [Candidatus Entotheonellia bacterium]
MPVPSTEGQQQAFHWIGQQLCGGCSDLRLAYADDNIALPSWQTQLVALNYPAAQNPPFSAQDFAAVKGQLLTEFTYVSHIQQFQENLATLWTDQQVNFALLVQAVGEKVTLALKPPPSSPVDKLLEAVIDKAIEITEQILSEGIVDVVKDVVEIEFPASVLQGVLGIATQMAKDSAGNSAADTVSATVADLDEQAAYSFNQHLAALGTMFDLIVEDWGKVQALGEKLNNPDNL